MLCLSFSWRSLARRRKDDVDDTDGHDDGQTAKKRRSGEPREEDTLASKLTPMITRRLSAPGVVSTSTSEHIREKSLSHFDNHHRLARAVNLLSLDCRCVAVWRCSVESTQCPDLHPFSPYDTSSTGFKSVSVDDDEYGPCE